jgi:hypothetical protein
MKKINNAPKFAGLTVLLLLAACGTPKPPPFAIGDISPRIAQPGETVTILGTGIITDGVKVKIGDQLAIIKTKSANGLYVLMPPLPAGDYNVTVINTGGESISKAGPSIIGEDAKDVIRNQSLVQLKEDVGVLQANAALKSENFRLLRYIPPQVQGGTGVCSAPLAVVEDRAGNRSTSKGINDLTGDQLEEVVYGADPLTVSSWDSYNDPAPAREQKLDLQAIQGQASYDTFSSRVPLNSVKIAVLDTGVSSHPEFWNLDGDRSSLDPSAINFTNEGNQLPPGPSWYANSNVADNSFYATQGRILGHGTAVASIAASPDGNFVKASNTSITGPGMMVGIAPGVTILPVKVCDGNNLCTGFQVVSGVCYAIAKGANVINLSLGGRQPSRMLLEALQEAARRGITVVAAAGNTGALGLTEPHYPAAYSPEVPGMLAVGSVNNEGVPSNFSTVGSYVDIAAPGENIYAASVSRGNSGFDYASFTGTSFAAPWVSGVAAMLKAQRPEWKPQELKNHLLKTAKSLKCDSNKCGAGLLNAAAAVAAP